MDFLESFEESTRHDVEKRAWMDEVLMELVTEDTLDRVVDDCIASGRYALDLETEGLDNRVFDNRTKHQIVGFCLSPDGKRGYYIPIRHKKGEDYNLSISRVEAAILRLILSNAVAIFHNAKFDHEFLQFSGGEALGTWDDARAFEDTLILAWLRDTRQKTKGLKFMSKTELGKDMIELKELFPPGYKGPLDFSLLDPSWDPCLWYACSDAICTFLLFDHLYPQVVAPEGDRATGQEVIYNIEKMCVPATRWMERCRVPIDDNKVAELMRLGQQELFDCLRDVYEFCNKALGRTVEPGWFEVLRTSFDPNDPSYDINQQIENCRKDAKRMGKDELDADGHFVQISKTVTLTIEGKEETIESFPEKYDVLSREQLGVLFCELEIPDLTRTGKSEQIQTTQEVIDHLEEMHGDRYPFLPKIKRLGELQKALGTYLISLHRDKGPDNTIKVNYNQFGTDTGRYTTPAAKNPAEDGGCKYPMHGTPATYDKSRPQCLLRIREAIRARPGKVMVSIDYGGVELRIATILSGEPKWLTEYFRCSSCGMEFDRGDGRTTPMPPPGYCPKCGDDKIGDLHTATAITFHGAEAVGGKEWKSQRQGAKCVHPDTLILAPRGLVRVGSAFTFGQADEFMPASGKVWNGDEFQEVKASYEGGVKELFHVVTHRGIVTCSDQHRFQTKDGKLLSIQSGLVEGVELETPKTPSLPPTGRWPQIKYRCADDLPEVSLQTSADLAYLAGLYAGDGTKDGDRSVSICHGHLGGVDKTGVPYVEWQEQIYTLASSLGFRPVKRKTSVYLGSRGVMRFFAACEFIGADERRRLRVPDWVLSAGREAAMQFVGGLIDSDGTIDKEDAEPSITTKDAVFAGQMMALLRALGFMPRAEPCWNTTYERWYYRIHVRASESGRLKKYIRHRGKRSRIRSSKPGTQPLKNAVLAVIPAGAQRCVDISMKGRKHLYWCGGLITHNSANFAMAYGGGASAIRRATGCDEVEAARHHRSFTSTNAVLKGWWDQIKSFGRVHGYVKTEFGRRYPIPDILLSLDPNEIRADLMADENRQKYAERIYDVMRRFYKIKSRKHGIAYDPDKKPLEMAVRATLHDYRADLAAGHKKAIDDNELKRKLIDSVKKAEVAVINEQVDRNKKFKAKAERNATNGPIQGLSADITKIAMALIYKECRKRGWLSKVLMIITIHDELVFEIDEDILAEAIELFQDIMSRNKTILNMKWAVPLTTDCEIGFDWTVPWNIKDFKYRRVRPDGLQTDEHGKLPRDKKTGKLVAKRWPEKFVKIFGPGYGFAPVLENPTQEEGMALFGPDWQPLPLSETPTEPTQPLQVAPATAAPGRAVEPAVEPPDPEDVENGTAELPAPPPVTRPLAAAPAMPTRPRLDKDEVYEFRVHSLAVGAAFKLAQVIVQCQGKGMNRLKVSGPEGENLLWPGADIRVSPVQFATAAEILGL